MFVLRHRLAVAGVITAAAIAVPVAALASGPGSPSGKPAPPQASAASASKSAAAAASSGSPSGKSAPPQASATGPAKVPQPDQPPPPVRAFAARLGVSTDAAGRAFKQILGMSSQNGVDPASPAFAAIARELGVSAARLAAAWDAVK